MSQARPPPRQVSGSGRTYFVNRKGKLYYNRIKVDPKYYYLFPDLKPGVHAFGRKRLPNERFLKGVLSHIESLIEVNAHLSPGQAARLVFKDIPRMLRRADGVLLVRLIELLHVLSMKIRKEIFPFNQTVEVYRTTETLLE